MTETERLQARIHNLELCIQGLHAILKDTLPAAYMEDCERLMEEHFYASGSLGAFKDHVLVHEPSDGGSDD